MSNSKIGTIGIFLLLFLAALQGFSVHAQDGGTLAYVGSALWTKAHDIEIQGKLAYCVFINGLVVLDISDIKNPVRVSQLYLADGSAGLQIVDIKNPAKPVPVGTLDTDGTSEGIALSGNHAFIADGASGLKVIDIGTPSRLRLAASLTASGYAHADYFSGIFFMDITSPQKPAAPKLEASFDTPGESQGVVLSGGLILVPDSNSLIILK